MFGRLATSLLCAAAAVLLVAGAARTGTVSFVDCTTEGFLCADIVRRELAWSAVSTLLLVCGLAAAAGSLLLWRSRVTSLTILAASAFTGGLSIAVFFLRRPTGNDVAVGGTYSPEEVRIPLLAVGLLALAASVVLYLLREKPSARGMTTGVAALTSVALLGLVFVFFGPEIEVRL